MIYQCNGCKRTTFETACPWRTSSELSTSPELSSRLLTPIDPSFYPDFQYRSKGLLQDSFGKKKEQVQLNDLLNNVLRKYSEAKHLGNLMRFFLSQLLPSAAWNILAPRNQPSSSEYIDGF